MFSCELYCFQLIAVIVHSSQCIGYHSKFVYSELHFNKMSYYYSALKCLSLSTSLQRIRYIKQICFT